MLWFWVCLFWIGGMFDWIGVFGLFFLFMGLLIWMLYE